MKNVSMNNFNNADSGKFGKAVEMAITGKARAKASNKVDWWHDRKRYEIKTGAGELYNLGEKTIKHCQYVVYVPVPLADKNGDIDIRLQEGYILTRDNFMKALEVAGALREKTSTAGVRKVTIQTFWNRSKMAPHGKLLDRMEDALSEYCECTLEEFLEG